MGKGKSPTAEELEFIYRLFTEIAGDSDVLKKYDELEQHGKLGSLPFRHDIRFIRQRRREFEAATRVLEKDFRRRADPVLAGYRKEHLAKVEDTIRRQKQQLGVPSPQYAPFPPELDQLPTYTSDPDRLPFHKLETHLPEAIRDKLEQRELKYGAYQESCSQLLKEIEGESEKRTGLKIDRSSAQRSVTCLTPFFSDLTYGDICERASGSPSGMLGDNPEYKLGRGPSGERELWLSRKRIAEASPDQIKHCRKVHKKMLREYRESRKADRLVQLYEDLTKFTETINRELEQVLLSHSYIQGQCTFCQHLWP